MVEIYRTPEERFSCWKQYPYEPHYLDWQGIRMHHLDEGPADGHVMLLLHGMPTSSYLYRRMIPDLVDAGYRCIAPDHVGFGKSDKVLDDAWYSIERHSQALAHLIQTLSLDNITLLCQDWGGPIGLRQVADMPGRFERLTIMNTWLHGPWHTYTDALKRWNRSWHAGGRMDAVQGCGFVLQNYLANYPKGSTPLSPDEAYDVYEAPFPDKASKAGPRRFPLSLPFDNPEGGNAEVQSKNFESLRSWQHPVHFIWGLRDEVFDEDWGRKWANHYPQATFDGLDAGHFLQETHGPEIARVLLDRIQDE